MDFGNDDLMGQQRCPTPARLRTILPGQFQPAVFLKTEVNFSFIKCKITLRKISGKEKKT